MEINFDLLNTNRLTKLYKKRVIYQIVFMQDRFNLCLTSNPKPRTQFKDACFFLITKNHIISSSLNFLKPDFENFTKLLSRNSAF